jgi:hypothetical protein
MRVEGGGEGEGLRLRFYQSVCVSTDNAAAAVVRRV